MRIFLILIFLALAQSAHAQVIPRWDYYGSPQEYFEAVAQVPGAQRLTREDVRINWSGGKHIIVSYRQRDNTVVLKYYDATGQLVRQVALDRAQFPQPSQFRQQDDKPNERP